LAVYSCERDILKDGWYVDECVRRKEEKKKRRKEEKKKCI